MEMTQPNKDRLNVILNATILARPKSTVYIQTVAIMELQCIMAIPVNKNVLLTAILLCRI